MDAIPIPTQVRNSVKGHRTRCRSTNEYSSSEGSSGHCTPVDANSPTDAFCPLSKSFHSASQFNVYGTSPRSTSVMFQYYNSPQTVYNKPPLSRTRSSDVQSSEHPRFLRAQGVLPSNSITSPNKLKVFNGPGGSNMNHLAERPRAWSESDKNRTNLSMQTSRMNALKKLKMKLGRSGNQRKMKNDHQDELNRSAASITSLEKVEEGRQLACSPNAHKNRLSADIAEEVTNNMGSMTVHNEVNHHGYSDTSTTPTSPLSPSSKSVAPNIYHRFLSEHSCYDLMPTSSKLVILDTRLEVAKAFDALVANNLRSAPLWDNEKSQYVGMLTVSDFLNILLAYHKNPHKNTSELEKQQISEWRKVLKSTENFVHVNPETTLLDSLNVLMDLKIRRLPVKNPLNGDIYHVVNYRRILHFLHLFMHELPKPEYMNKSLQELNIGTFDSIATITQDEEVARALELIAEYRISGLPVVDESGVVTDLFTKTDVLMLAGENLFHDLSIKVSDVLKLTNNNNVDIDNTSPPVRKIPASPALPRRNKQAQQQQQQPVTRKTSREGKQTSHPFLRQHNPEPSPLIKGVSGTQVTKRSSAHIKGHPAIEKHKYCFIPPQSPLPSRKKSPFEFDSSIVAKQKSKENLQNNLPVDRTQARRHRHASTQSCKGEMSTHLVLVDIHNTLGNVVDSLVFNDALQAIIVNHSGQAEGIVSIGDVLRFMTTITEPTTPKEVSTSATEVSTSDELDKDQLKFRPRNGIIETNHEMNDGLNAGDPEALTNGAKITRQ